MPKPTDNDKRVFRGITNEQKFQVIRQYLWYGSNMAEVGKSVFRDDKDFSAQEKVSVVTRCYGFEGQNRRIFRKWKIEDSVIDSDIRAFIRKYPNGCTYDKKGSEMYTFLIRTINARQTEGGGGSDWDTDGFFDDAGGSGDGGYSEDGDSFFHRILGGIGWLFSRLKLLAVVLGILAVVIFFVKNKLDEKKTAAGRLPVTGKLSQMNKKARPLTSFRLDRVYYLGKQSLGKPKGLCARYDSLNRKISLVIGTWSSRMCKGVTTELTGSWNDEATSIHSAAMGIYKKSEKNGWVATIDYTSNQVTIARYKNGIAQGNGVILCDGSVQLYNFKNAKVLGYFKNGQWVSENGKKLSKGKYKSIHTTDGASFTIGKNVYVKLDGDELFYENGKYKITANRTQVIYETRVKDDDVKYVYDTEISEFMCYWGFVGALGITWE